MTTCTRLSDRMPAVALGRGRWTADDERHLASCDECRAEWGLVFAASRLGAGLPAPADPGRTAAGALERLHEVRARARRRARTAAVSGVAAAAVVALAVWGGRNGREGPTGTRPAPATPAPVAAVPVPEPGALRPPPSGVTGRAPAGPGLELPLPELDSLPADVLDSMLQSLDEPLTRVGAYDLPADDSGDQELARALADLEG